MAVKIDPDECTRCDDCIPACPTKSITVFKGSLKVSADTCTECDGHYDSPKCIDTCPSGSIAYA
jgi:ferredoxin